MKIECLQANQWRRVKRVRMQALEDAPDAFCSSLAYAKDLSDKDWIKSCQQSTAFFAVDGQQDIGMVRCVADSENPDCALLISMWVAPVARKTGFLPSPREHLFEHRRE